MNTSKYILLAVAAFLVAGTVGFYKAHAPSTVAPTPAPTSSPQPAPTPSPIPSPTPRPGQVDTGVEGIVTIGPTCPVMRMPPDPQCADKPYQTKLVIGDSASGNGGTLVLTGKDGYFSKELTPGTYTIRAESTASLPRLSPVTFTVKAHERTSLNLQFDSGIR